MAFIVERCPDIELLAEIEDLLRYQRSSHQAGVFRAMESDRDVTVDSENLLTKRLAVLDAGPTEGEVGPADRGLTADGLPYSIGAYRVVKWLGEGGMATVYLAEQQHPRRTVALKVIKAGLGGAEILRRFDQEANLLARLQHPGIAQVYEAGTAATPFGAQPFFVMEFIKGEPLDRYAATHQLTTRQRLELMCDVCDGVHHAHLRGIIHRDLKPANILVDESGQPKILDFGIAHATESDGRATQQTERGQILGTPQYMSPEQVLADPSAIDNRSDVYTIGVMLYNCLRGDCHTRSAVGRCSRWLRQSARQSLPRWARWTEGIAATWKQSSRKQWKRIRIGAMGRPLISPPTCAAISTMNRSLLVRQRRPIDCRSLFDGTGHSPWLPPRYLQYSLAALQ